MTERMRFIARWSEHEGNFAALCREFDISRKTGYKWLERYERDGPSGLEDRGPIARECPHRTPEDVVDRVVTARKEHPTWGPRKVRAWLVDRDPELEQVLPATSTIGDIFNRHGLLRPRRRRLRVPFERLPLAESAGPNEIWSADFKGHFALRSREYCYPLTIADVYSRYFLKCEGLLEPREEPVRRQFELAFNEFGLPKRIRTDNGSPFASTSIGGLTSLVVWWIKLGIVPERIEPGHPEQNGRHERLHRTLKEEATKPPACDMASQQRAFDRFRHEYNDERPHEALGDRPPGRISALSLRTYPTTLSSPEYEPDYVVRRVVGGSHFTWGGSKIRVPRCLAGEPVGLKEVEEDRWQLRYGPLVLAILDGRGPTTRLTPVDPAEPDSGARAPVPGDRGASPCAEPVTRGVGA